MRPVTAGRPAGGPGTPRGPGGGPGGGPPPGPREPELVDIPATFCLDNGVWYAVRQGVRGLLARDEQGESVAYVLCEPATRYYQVMTRSDRMPVLIGERI
jgi:hypothetical protein